MLLFPFSLIIDMIKFSIVICTYNRVSYLRETIDSLLAVLKSHNNYELIIIDNNSTDETSTIIKLYNGVPEIRYFLEQNQGLSYARNRGIVEAKGELLIFLDDDIEIEENYFTIIERLFVNSKINIVGGKVLPYKINVPDWLPLKYYYLASIFDPGDKERSVKKIMGANYAMRKTIAQKIGWYDTNLGRKGSSLMGGEEVDYLNRAQIMGIEVLYSPLLIVFHKINDKLTKGYILSYSYQLGISEILIDRKKSIIKTILKICRSIMDFTFYTTVGVLIPNQNVKMLFCIRSYYAKGYLKGMINLLK